MSEENENTTMVRSTKLSTEPSKRSDVTTHKIRKPRFTPEQTIQYTIGGAVLSFILQIIFWRPDMSLCSLFRFFTVIFWSAYLPSYFDGTEMSIQGRFWEWATYHPIWKKMFPKSELIFTGTKPDPSKQYIICLSPHGVASFSHWFLTTLHLRHWFPKRRHLGGSIVFKIPFWRDIMLAAGVIDSGKANTETLLSNGMSLLVLPGGISEQVRAEYKKHLIYIRKRTGIFYYALKYQVPVIPFFSFQENDLFDTYSWYQKFRNMLADKFQFPLCFINPIIKPVPLHIYAGEPLLIPIKGETPTPDEVTQLQEMYISELCKMYEENKKNEGYPDGKLEIM